MSVEFTRTWWTGVCAAATLALSVTALPAHAQNADMTFFVTSHGIGNGGNLGGLAGADNWCQQLAQEAGAGAKTWRAYLSTQAADGQPAVNARDRIGKGPWQNAKGEVIALTGSQADGTAFPAGEDRTCKNWTSSTQGAAMLGHADRMGLTEDPPAKSWNSSHPSRGPDGGCSQADLRSTGGDGLLYCFAAN